MKNQSYKQLFKQKNYMKMLSANLINRFGDSIDAIAMTWLIYQLSSSAALSALNYGLNYIPSILFTPFAGAFVEKRNKKWIMVISDLGRGIIVCIIAWLAYQNLLEGWMLLISTFLLSTFEAFRTPCTTAMIPSLVDKEMYSYATSLSASLSSSVELIGTALAALILHLLGMSGAILIDALTFFLSACILLTLHYQKTLTVSHKTTTLTEFKEGLNYVKTHSMILFICFMATMLNLCFTPVNSLQSVLVSEIYAKGTEVLSLQGLAISIGMIVGSLLYPKIKEKIKTNQLILINFLMIGCFLINLILLGNVAYEPLFYLLLIIVCFICGFAVGLLNNSTQVLLLKSIDPDYLARTSSIFSAISICSIPIGSWLISLLTFYLSIETIFIGTGLFAILIVLGIKCSTIYHRIEEV